MTKLHLTHLEKERYLFHASTTDLAEDLGDGKYDEKPGMSAAELAKYFWFPVLTNSNVSEIDIYTGAVVNEIDGELIHGADFYGPTTIQQIIDFSNERTGGAPHRPNPVYPITNKWNQVEISWCLCGPGMDLTFIGNRGHSAFKGRDLTGCIEGVNFSHCDLTGTKF